MQGWLSGAREVSQRTGLPVSSTPAAGPANRPPPRPARSPLPWARAWLAGADGDDVLWVEVVPLGSGRGCSSAGAGHGWLPMSGTSVTSAVFRSTRARRRGGVAQSSSKRASRSALAGWVVKAAVPGGGGPLFVSVDAAGAESVGEPVQEHRQVVPLPFLEGLTGQCQPRGAALVGEGGQLVRDVRVRGPARRDQPVHAPAVLVVDPGGDFVQPRPHLSPDGETAGGRVPGPVEVLRPAQHGLGLFGAELRQLQIPVGVLHQPSGPRERAGELRRRFPTPGVG